MSRTTRALPAAAVLLALTGCSDDGDAADDPSSEATSTSTSAGPTDEPTEEPTAAETASTEPAEPADPAAVPTKEEFIAQAGEVCAASGQKIQAASGELDPADPDGLATFTRETLVPELRARVEALRALGAPEGDEAAVDGILAGFSAAIDATEADPSVLNAEDNPFAEVDSQLTTYGVVGCGSEES